MKLFIAILTLCCLALAGKSQSIQSSQLSWSVSGIHDLRTDTVTQTVSRFDTSPGLLKWIQKNGAYVYEFNVTGSSGSWPDVSSTGQFVFQVQFRNYSGSIVFKRTSSGITIEPDIRKNGQNMFPYSLNCSSVTPTQP